jgi:glycosyltransferase involved in cell wall biosynthesis
MEANGEPRVVLVHDWLTGMRGGEKCLEIACRRWPKAPLFTLLHRPGSVSEAIEQRPLCTSWLQRIPNIDRFYRFCLPFMPAAANAWRLPAADLVVSFSHCVAKAARPPRGVPHVCYCFTPMRYAWNMREAYFGNGSLRARLVDPLLAKLRDWDRRTAQRVTHFIAISETVRKRILNSYGRESRVIYPPVDTAFYYPAAIKREAYYLVVSAFAPYKRLDLALAACAQLRRPLVVIGSGQDYQRLQSRAGSGVHFLGWQPSAIIRDHLRRCRALLFPGEEDFGIVPVEAMACGTPVIAFGKGGATETIIPPGGLREPTGLWFEEQSIDCLASAILDFEAQVEGFSATAARRQALRFDSQYYADQFFGYLEEVLCPMSAPVRRAA